MNEIQVFNNADLGIAVRAILDEKGEPHFCVKAVCEALGLTVNGALKRLEKGVISIHPLMSNGGMQNFTFVSEDGLYDTILESRKPAARKFRKWITSEVVPSTRKTGSYAVPGSAVLSAELKEAVVLMLETLKNQNQINETMHGMFTEMRETVRRERDMNYEFRESVQQQLNELASKVEELEGSRQDIDDPIDSTKFPKRRIRIITIPSAKSYVFGLLAQMGLSFQYNKLPTASEVTVQTFMDFDTRNAIERAMENHFSRKNWKIEIIK